MAGQVISSVQRIVLLAITANASVTYNVPPYCQLVVEEISGIAHLDNLYTASLQLFFNGDSYALWSNIPVTTPSDQEIFVNSGGVLLNSGDSFRLDAYVDFGATMTFSVMAQLSGTTTGA